MRVLAWVAGGYAALVAGAYGVQRALMYPAPRAPVEPQVRGGSILRIPGDGGRTVHALHVPSRDDAPTVVHFHGNGESLADVADFATALSGGGVGVLAVEYPGYGLSRDGKPNEAALYADAETAIVHLRDSLGVSHEETVLLGQSLGSGVAVEMARRGHGARLVLIAPFTSMTDLVQRIAPILPASLIVRDRYDNRQKAPAIVLPVLIVHGSEDEVVPVSMGQRLANLFPNCRLYISPGAHHNDLFITDGRRILDTIAAFARGES